MTKELRGVDRLGDKSKERFQEYTKQRKKIESQGNNREGGKGTSQKVMQEGS